MDEHPELMTADENPEAVTRPYLESLTTDDLLGMAEDWGLDIPFGLDRIFIIEELLDLVSGEEEAADIPPEPEMVDTGARESVPLPRQYNITFIEAIVRDPLWAFVFWEIKAQDRELYEKAQDFSGYYLKVSPAGNTAASGSAQAKNPSGDNDGVYRVQVKPEDGAWYLGFSPVSSIGDSGAARNQYKVELCAVFKDNETVLAASNTFRLPELCELPSMPGKGESSVNALCRLSGYGDFHILRNSERLFRSKRGVPAGSYE